jgi:hypothetical protein
MPTPAGATITAFICCDVGWLSHHRAGASASHRFYQALVFANSEFPAEHSSDAGAADASVVAEALAVSEGVRMMKALARCALLSAHKGARANRVEIPQAGPLAAAG